MIRPAKTRTRAALIALALAGLACAAQASSSFAAPETLEDLQKEWLEVKKRTVELNAKMKRQAAEGENIRRQNALQSAADEGIALADLPANIDASEVLARVEALLDSYRSKMAQPEPYWTELSDSTYDRRFNCDFNGQSIESFGPRQCWRRVTPPPYQKNRKLAASSKPQEVRACFNPDTDEIKLFKLRYRVDWKRALWPDKTYWVDMIYSAKGEYLGANADPRLAEWSPKGALLE